MELKGKCKIDFDKWFYAQCVNGSHLDSLHDNEYFKFWKLTDSMQFGVIQDFADSVGIGISINFYSSEYCDFDIQNNDGDDLFHSNLFDELTRQESRLKSIEKFSELYNSAVQTAPV